MKRLLLAVATALMILNTLAIPTVARADGGGNGGTTCGGGVCKP